MTGERPALLVGSNPEPREHFRREVLDARTAALGQGAATLSPSASLPQAMLYVGSASRVVEVPMAMCGLYRNNCESCLLARDPYCGWAGGRCQSVYQNRYVAPTARCFSDSPGSFISRSARPFPLPGPIPLPGRGCGWFWGRLPTRGRSRRVQAVPAHTSVRPLQGSDPPAPPLLSGRRSQWVSYNLSTQLFCCR